MEDAGHLDEAEAWYTQLLNICRSEMDSVGESVTRGNLARLLRTHAERALGIKAALDLATAEIWKIYSVLADIAAKQGDADAARFYGERREQATQHSLVPGIWSAARDH